jgi:hypothetical protein
MSETVTVALIVSVAPTLTALVGLWATLRQGRRVDSYKHEVNSRMDELLQVTGERSRAEGRAEGIASERVKGIS